MAGNIDIRTKVGLRIKELRLESGMSQEDFANHIDMARSYFAEVETGKRNVSIANLEIPRVANRAGRGNLPAPA